MLHNRKYQSRRYELFGSHATTTSKPTAMSLCACMSAGHLAYVTKECIAPFLRKPGHHC